MATVTITGFTIPDWHFGGSTCKLRLYSKIDWIDSLSVPHLHGTIGSSTGFYQEVACTISGTTITVPTFTTPSTADALDPSSASTILITGILFDSTGARKQDLFKDFQIQTTSPITFDALKIRNRARTLPNAPATYLDAAGVQTLIASALGSRNHASKVVEGTVKTRTVPTDSLNPTVLEVSDGLSLGIVRVTDYTATIVTVLAPAIAPTLAVTSGFYGAGVFTDTTTYLVAYTYVAWTGETQISPTASFTCANGQLIAVLPKAPKATRAVGAKVYISADGGVNYHLADGPFTTGTILGFGDELIWGGVPVRYNGAGAAPPGSNTATDRDGTVIANPTLAPALNDIAKVTPSTTFYGAFSYVGEDGTETALSPFSTSVTTGASTNYLYFRINEEPPNGAVFKKLYIGTAATTAAMKLQATVPLHYVTAEIHSYTLGATPSAGTPQSTISTFQQAYDAAMLAGGGQVLVPPGPHDFKVPIILRLKNSSNVITYGIRIQGTGGHDANGTTSLSRLRYTGTTTGVESLVFATQSLTWGDVDVADPNSRVKYALAMCDYGVGGGAFTSKWMRSGFQAIASGGRGLIVSLQSRNAGSHTASEQEFDWCTFGGDAWAVDLAGGQTGDFRFQTPTLGNSGNSNSANSGDYRAFDVGFNVIFKDYNSNGYGGYNFYLTGHEPHAFGGASNTLTLVNPYTENQVANFFLYVSATNTNSGIIHVSRGSFGNQTGHEIYSLYAGTASTVTYQANDRGGGNIWLNHADASLLQMGGDQMFRIGQDYFKQTSPSYTTARPAISIYGSVQRFVNETNNASTIQTNTAGDLVLTPFNGVTIGGGTAIKKTVVYTPSLTPAAISANTSVEQDFTVSGLTTADKVIVNGPAPTAGTALVAVRVKSANTLSITFGNFTAGALTPTSGTYSILAVRS